MNDSATVRLKFPIRSIVYCVLAIAHAALVFLLWYAAMFLDNRMVGTTLWLVLAWTWLLWLPVLIPRARREAKLVVPTLLVCVGLMIPCISTIYTFTVWTLP